MHCSNVALLPPQLKNPTLITNNTPLSSLLLLSRSLQSSSSIPRLTLPNLSPLFPRTLQFYCHPALRRTLSRLTHLHALVDPLPALVLGTMKATMRQTPLPLAIVLAVRTSVILVKAVPLLLLHLCP